MKIFFIILLFSVSLAAQRANFINLTTKSGLNEAQIYSILQDKKGFIYLGTNGGGVNKFDGSYFQTINTTNGIGGNVIYKLLQDHKNNIWAATNGGLTKYDGKKFYNFSQQNSSLNANSILTVFEDSNGQLWLGTNAGVYRYDGNNFTKVNISSLPEKFEVLDFAEDNNQNIWAGSEIGLIKISGDSIKILTKDDGLPNSSVWSLRFDRANILWVGTKEGICSISNNVITKYKQQGLNDVPIWAIYQDKRNRIWIGSSDGLYKYDGNLFQRYTKQEGLINNTIWAITEDSEGNLWIGTTNGVSILKDENFTRYDKSNLIEGIWSITEMNGSLLIATESAGLVSFSNNKFSVYSPSYFPSGKAIWSLFKDSKGNLWIGTEDGVIRRTDDNQYSRDLEGKSILTIYEDKKGNIWFGTFLYGIFKFDGEKFSAFPLPIKSYIPVHSFLDDSRGTFWAATDKMLYKLQSNVFVEAEEAKQLGGYAIIKVIEDDYKNLWFGLYGGGIAFYNVKTNTVRHITTNEGLNNNSVLIMQFDKNDYMWIGTNTGLNRLNWKKYASDGIIDLLAYNSTDGLPGTECNQGAALLDSKGYFWIGTSGGLLKFKPSEIKIKSDENKTYITDLRLFLENVDLTPYSSEIINPYESIPPEIKLPYDQNHLTFDFVGINYLSPMSVRYQYKLKGFDKKWSPVTNKNSATYSNLPPGKYTFIVKSRNIFNIWNSVPASYSFTIEKPFWQTYWFYSFVIIFSLGSAYGFYKIRIEKIQKRNRALQQRIKERMEFEGKLAQSEQDYRGLFENAHDAILITNPHSILIYDANDSAAQLYGYNLSELKKLSLLDLSAEKESSWNFWESFVEQKKFQNLEATYKKKDGSIIYIDINATMIKYKGKDAILSIHRDISERKKYESVLLEAKENAEKSDRLKTEFLAQMSHEIRTPINSILSYSSLIKEELADKIQPFIQSCFETIETASTRLIRTVDSILNMAQIQTGNFEIDNEIIDLKDNILKELTEEFTHLAKQKGLELNFVDRSENRLVESDKYTTTHLFANLIENAVKYTKSGSIKIVLYNNQNYMTCVDIIDTGIGISAEYLPNLFEAFSQEDQGYSRKYEGNGLGLALVKKYCEMNNAEISVKSKKDVGTTFTVTFKPFIN